VARKEKEMVLTVMVEIPKGSRNKYEYDNRTKQVRFDRMLFSSVHYPSDYGFIFDTKAKDGDALDALILVEEPTFPGCVIQAKPVGVFRMSDERGPDEKILCVPMTDPMWNHIDDIKQVPPHLLREIKHFFSIYKDLEGKSTTVEGWEGKGPAIKLINEARKRFGK
jgi:inorganic pyrophosphatase